MSDVTDLAAFLFRILRGAASDDVAPRTVSPGLPENLSRGLAGQVGMVSPLGADEMVAQSRLVPQRTQQPLDWRTVRGLTPGFPDHLSYGMLRGRPSAMPASHPALSRPPAEPGPRPISDLGLALEGQIRDRAQTQRLPEFKQWFAHMYPGQDRRLAEMMFRIYQQAWHTQEEVDAIHSTESALYARSRGERGVPWEEIARNLRYARVTAPKKLAKAKAAYQQGLADRQRWTRLGGLRTPGLDRDLRHRGLASLLTGVRKGRYMAAEIDDIRNRPAAQYAAEAGELNRTWDGVAELLKIAGNPDSTIRACQQVYNQARLRTSHGASPEGVLSGAAGFLSDFYTGLNEDSGQRAFGDDAGLPSFRENPGRWSGGTVGGIIGGEGISAPTGVAQRAEEAVSPLASRVEAAVGRRLGRKWGEAAGATVREQLPGAATSAVQSGLSQLGNTGQIDLGGVGKDVVKDLVTAAVLRGALKKVAGRTRRVTRQPARVSSPALSRPSATRPSLDATRTSAAEREISYVHRPTRRGPHGQKHR